MNIQITDDLRLTSDDFNYIVRKRKIVQTGKHKGEIKWDPISYHNTMGHVAKSLMQKNLRWSDAETVEQLEQEHDRFKKIIADKFNMEMVEIK